MLRPISATNAIFYQPFLASRKTGQIRAVNPDYMRPSPLC